MIAPLHNFKIKGVLWYQGETNAGRSGDYTDLMKTLVSDWRTRWGSDFPFVYMQLPNFGDPQRNPSEGSWAYMREAQLRMLEIPNSAMVVTIDVGEWNDIHPLKKQDVGMRTSLAAQKLAYGELDLVASGPIYQSMKIKKNKAIISFSNIGSGLKIKNGKTVSQIAIAGADGVFVWANAKIAGNNIVVWHKDIKQPVAVRYAWSDNPFGCNLYNKEGLPASPFRTDDWNKK
jgi:sialate O-acetylesterase